MKVRLPWWHALLKPWFSWRADVRERKAAELALNEYKLVGYFLFYDPKTGEGLEHIAIACLENGRGARKIEFFGSRFAEAGFVNRPAVKAWLAGDPSADRWISKKLAWPKQDVNPK